MHSRIFSIILFCVLATAQHPFAASLAGIHLRDHDEEEILHLSNASWPSPRALGRNAARPSFDTSIYTPSFQPTTSQQEDWLPKLSFDTPTERNHPARRISLDHIQFLRHKESNLLPSPAILQCSEGFSALHSLRGRPPLVRSATTHTATSSIYSQSTAADSTFSKHARTMSSFSDDSSIFTPMKSPPLLGRTLSCKPSVPSIPEQYLPPPITSSLRNGGRPRRPRSRPRLVSKLSLYGLTTLLLSV